MTEFPLHRVAQLTQLLQVFTSLDDAKRREVRQTTPTAVGCVWHSHARLAARRQRKSTKPASSPMGRL